MPEIPTRTKVQFLSYQGHQVKILGFKKLVDGRQLHLAARHCSLEPRAKDPAYVRPPRWKAPSASHGFTILFVPNSIVMVLYCFHSVSALWNVFYSNMSQIQANFCVRNTIDPGMKHGAVLFGVSNPVCRGCWWSWQGWVTWWQ